MANLLDRMRRWIDGDDDDLAEKVFIENAESYESENFLRKLLQRIDEVLKTEIVRLPNGKAYVPPQFIVYLNEQDYGNLRKDKRKFFEEALSELILEKAHERAGNAKLSAKSIKPFFIPLPNVQRVTQKFFQSITNLRHIHAHIWSFNLIITFIGEPRIVSRKFV